VVSDIATMFKMTPEIEELIRELSASGKSGRAIARELGCSQTSVRRILNPESIKRAKRKYRQSPHGRQKEQEYRSSTKEQMQAYSRQHYLENLDRYKERNRHHYQENKAYYAEKCMRYHAAKLQATPAWLAESDLNEMRAIYLEAQRLTKETGILHDVDHIDPLQGKTVCGLHCPLNLQILTAPENRSKGNKI